MSSSIKPLPLELLYWIKNPGMTAFTLRFRNIHAFTWTKAQWIDNPIHPLTSVALERYAVRQGTPLWLTCVATREAGHSDRVVRSWLARKAKHALAESLKKKGFDMEGRKLPGSGNKADLFGTALFSVMRLAATTPYVDLIKQTDVAVSYMQKFQNREKDGQKNGKGKGHVRERNYIEFPSILLPPNISSGSIVDITVARNLVSEQKSQSSFIALQDAIFHSFGASEPSPPVLRCKNATQTSVVLEWDTIEVATADIISLSLYRNGQKAGSIPRPGVMLSTKISGLAVDTEYTFHLILRTSAGTFSSEKVVVKTHKMTDLSGITVTAGILPAQLRESLTKAIERIGAKMADTVRIDTTHFVTTEGRGIAWEKAGEMNIPIVRPEWVEGCERGGRIVGVRQYYLDADPRQRQVVQTQPEPQAAKQSSLPTPPADTNGSGSHQAIPPTPPAKDAPKEEEESSEEDEEDDEKEKTQVAHEQKVRVQDREQQKVALRPMAPSEETEETKDEASEEAEGGSGSATPGASSFQDVAL
ncbi:Chitin biosynthesis CHS5 [Hyphodiscus hymeniophilus]|uniref:Chitin biosynthesis CHS5 n=1 Tax=Hyphodiscus hymeniophilus TaxID=353542 RepID=A0A9P6VPR8_9HELO|nr:Chitin biosynthesis CHS5 [Hyphodiscus hymeniophilus]